MFATKTNTPEYPPASMLTRTIAFFLDIFLVFLLSLAMVAAIYPEGMETFQAFSEQAANTSNLKGIESEIKENEELRKFASLITSTSFLIMLLYFSVAEALLSGATLGKKIFNLRTAYRDSPRIPPLGQLFIRAFIKTFTFFCFGVNFLFIFFGNFLIAYFRRDRRTLHDLLTKTSVVPGFLPDSEEERQH